MSLCKRKLSCEPATAVFHFLGKLENSEFPSPFLVKYFSSSKVYGLVSIISFGSIPANGLPVTFLGLSNPDWMVSTSASFRRLRISGRSLIRIPRSWRFCRVVISQLPSSA